MENSCYVAEVLPNARYAQSSDKLVLYSGLITYLQVQGLFLSPSLQEPWESGSLMSGKWKRKARIPRFYFVSNPKL